MKKMLFATSVAALCLALPAPVGAQDGEGLLVPVGGGYADVYPGIVASLLERNDDGAVNVTVLPTTYSTNAEAITQAEFERNMADAERRRFELEAACQRAAPPQVTCKATIAPIFTRADAEEESNLAYFTDEVDGVFILGGDQTVAMAALVGTPVEAALTRLYAAGRVVGGTSAGGAVLSRVMVGGYSPNFADATSLNQGAADLWNDSERRGLIFGVDKMVVDQHLFQRGRLGRLLEAILRPDAPHIGLGIDGYTGLRIKAGEIVTGVFGLYTAVVLDAATYGAADGVTYAGDAGFLSVRNVLVHLLAPGDFSYDVASRQASLAPPAATLTRTHKVVALPDGAGPLFLTGGLAPESSAWDDFLATTAGDPAPLLVLAAGFPNARPAQRAADKLAKALGGTVATAVLGKDEDVLASTGPYRGIVVLGKEQSLLQPAHLTPVKERWQAGTPLLLDGAAAALAGPVFSAHGEPAEGADAAEMAAQRSFLEGRTAITDGLGLLDVTVEPQILTGNRWGRLFSLAYTHPAHVALAIPADSMLVVTDEGSVVAGANAILSLDLRTATLALGDNTAFVIANGLLDVFAPGDEVRLHNP